MRASCKHSSHAVRRALVESLESRWLPAATLLGTATLPGIANNNWDYSRGPFNASPILTGQTGSFTNILLTVGGDGNLYGYEYNNTTNQLELYGGSNQTPNAVPPIQATPAVADVPNVGRIIYAATVDGTVYAWDITTGQLQPGWPVSVAIPAALDPPAGLSNAVVGAITTADLDGDGSPEILVTSVNHELTVFHADGTVAWRFNNDSPILGGAVVGDLDGDGHPEVVIAGQSDADANYAAGGRITALSADGKRIWVRQTPQPIDSSPVLADLQGHGHLDVVVGTGYRNRDPNGLGNRVYAIDPAGHDLPGWPYITNADPNVDAGVFTSPAIGDLNGDGILDVAIADAQGHVQAISGTGQLLWNVAGFSGAVYGSPVIADVDGDGVLDVIVAGGNSVRAFSGTNGTKVFDYTDQSAQQVFRTTPALGHFTTDTTVQLAFVGNKPDSNTVSAPGILHVYDLGTPTVAPAWSMLRQDAAGEAVARTAAETNTLLDNLYSINFGRSPSAGETALWTPVLVHFPNPADLIYSFLSGSTVRQSVISSWYTTYLGRAGETDGIAEWQGFLAQGNSYAAAKSFFVGSDEAFNDAGGTNSAWVTWMYQKLLGRTPGDDENAIWTGALNAGTVQRSDVVHDFLFSQELSEQQVNNWYAQYQPHGQSVPTAEELQAAGWDLRRGKTEEHVLTQILVSGGNYDITQQEDTVLRTLYQDILGRAAGASEIIYWLGALEHGANLGTVSQSIAGSYEYRDQLVAQYYSYYLGRTASFDERAYWVNALGTGLSRQAIIAGFMASDEYFNQSGGTLNAFIQRAWMDTLGHGALPQNFTDWNAAANAGQPVRSLLPVTLLQSTEFFMHQINIQFWQYLRHAPTTSPDSSENVPSGTPYGAQYWLDYLANGGRPEDMESAIVSSAEYAITTGEKTLWAGTRWNSVT